METPNLVLVPYDIGHVPKYHEWMSREELQKLTASEPLTLNEVDYSFLVADSEVSGRDFKGEVTCLCIISIHLGKFNGIYYIFMLFMQFDIVDQNVWVSCTFS